MPGYQRFATPRAYVDTISTHIALGTYTTSNITIKDDAGSTVVLEEGNKDDLFDMKPHNYVVIPKETQQFYIELNTGFGTDLLQGQNFIAFLGHNLHSANAVFKIEVSDSSDFSSGNTTINAALASHTINAAADSSADYFDPATNGWTLIAYPKQTGVGNRYLRITVTDDDSVNDNFSVDIAIGAICYGEYIDWPHAMDINLTTAYDYDGTTLHNAVGGSTYASSTHYGAPVWHSTQPWSLTNTDNENYHYAGRRGRMRHSMNFSHMADTNLFAQNQADYYDFYLGLNSDGSAEDNLHSQFYNKVIGQHNPFMWTMDKTSTNEADYGIYRLADNSFEAKQIGSRVWNVNMDLIESW